MKTVIDQLLAVICVRVVAWAIDRHATTYGDGDAAIQVPSRR